MAGDACRLGIMQLVTVETAIHGGQTFDVGHDAHLTHFTMTGLALYTCIQMLSVIPRHPGKQRVYPDPRHRRARFIVLSEFFDARFFTSHRCVALHARSGFRKCHRAAGVWISVATQTFQSQRQMNLVAVGNGLRGSSHRFRSIVNIRRGFRLRNKRRNNRDRK